MSGIALALIIAGAVVIRGGLIGLTPLDAFRDIFDRSMGGEGLAAVVANQDPNRFGSLDFGGLPTGPPASAKFDPNVERWRGIVAAYFPPAKVDEALSVMHCESRGNPNAVNPVSRASGLFQHMPAFWGERSRAAGVPGASIFDPVANVRVAGWLYTRSGTWSHWSCKPTV